ncbi:MAG: hypothetical protein D6722_09825 [Bacteroidetes bacterium]|nr:MAG: hypothetical protein D6722_09825 [Bacteroidota bacterium]
MLEYLPGEKEIMNKGGYILTTHRVLKDMASDTRCIFLKDVSFIGYTVSRMTALWVVGVLLLLAGAFAFAEIKEEAGGAMAFFGVIFLIAWLLGQKLIRVVSSSGDSIEWQVGTGAQKVVSQIARAKAAIMEGTIYEEEEVNLPTNTDVKGALGL